MEYVVYCLYSERFDKLYIGQTESLIQRFYSHNKLSNDSYTRSYRPWKVIYVEYYDSRVDALRREKQLKTGKGRDWLRNSQLTLMKTIEFI